MTLITFMKEVEKEAIRGFEKYGPWEELSNKKQRDAVKSECLEWEAASLKTGKEGVMREMQELTHLANCCAKRWIELHHKLSL
jgi:hypothetical protein